MRTHRVAAAALALTTGVIGFAIGRGTGSGREPRPEAGFDHVAARGEAAHAIGGDSSVSLTGDSTASPRKVADAEPKPARAAVTANANATRSANRNANANPNAKAASGRRRVTLGDLDLTGVGYDRGDPDAPLVLIDFSDFGCPYCGEFARETYPEIDRDYIQTGKVYFKYVPFLAGFANGREATRASECAADQGKFWEMADAVYATQSEWQKAWDPHAELRKVAGTVGLDSAAYWACYSVHRPDARTRRATDVADKVQVRVTPSFVLNGRPVEGALPLAAFRKLLDASLIMEESKR